MADSLGDFGAGHSPVQVKHLWPNLLHDVGGGLDAHELVPEDITRPNNLNFIDVITVEGGDGHAAPIHLPGENLISKEPVTKDAAVTIRTVQAFGTSYIDQISQH